MSSIDDNDFGDREALAYHRMGKAGKIDIVASKPMATQRDLSLAYSPGVAAPVRAIAADPDSAYDYTIKGNLVAVISNGTAILGLGNLGALASKPVMEGKAVLFKRFADIDSIDLEVDTEDVDKFIACVELLEPSFGGINLEDIKAPECFIIETTLKERMNIPVFHDDQHGTAIVAAAGLINALHLTGRNPADVKMVVNGAGAAAIACTELIKLYGVRHVIMCDTSGVIYKGREKGMNQWKSAHAADTPARSLEEAMVGADVFMGLSQKGAVSPEMVASMAPNPIIFAMANPDPEITPEEVHKVRGDAIVATGRSDYPNQVNNVLCFPYLFRGALDVRATAINEQMKLAAANAIASLARMPVPDEVAAAYGGKSRNFGPEYIIPAPFDPRLIEHIPTAVAKAAMASGAARKPFFDEDAYRQELRGRLNPTTSILQGAIETAQSRPRRAVFAEAEQDVVLRAAMNWKNSGYGTPVLVGKQQTIFVADTTVTERPSAESLATIAIETAAVARRLGQEPRVAFLSYSNFGNPRGEFVDNVRDAVKLLDNRQVGFEYEGEMSADVALNPAMRAQYPFNRLSGPANVLIMPGLHSANIAAKLIKEVANLRVVGPMLVNMSKPVQIVPMNSSASDIVTLGVLASTGVVC